MIALSSLYSFNPSAFSMVLGYLNLSVLILGLNKLTVFFNPTKILLVTLNIAVKGETTAPKTPLPNPLKKPLTPSFFAPSYGLNTIPIIPFPKSLAPSFNPV